MAFKSYTASNMHQLQVRRSFVSNHSDGLMPLSSSTRYPLKLSGNVTNISLDAPLHINLRPALKEVLGGFSMKALGEQLRLLHRLQVMSFPSRHPPNII